MEHDKKNERRKGNTEKKRGRKEMKLYHLILYDV